MTIRFNNHFTIGSGKRKFRRKDTDDLYLYSEGTYLFKSGYRGLQQKRERYSWVKYVIFLLIMLLFSILLRANTFPVTNTNDAGPGSLRQAILDVNAAGAGPHNIAFNVYGQITILSSLPQITNSDVTIDGQNKITINSNGTNTVIDPFLINANNVTIQNFRLTNAGNVYFTISPNTTGVTIENIYTSSNTGNWLNVGIYVAGASTNLTIRNVTITDIEPCTSGNYVLGRSIYFTGGTQTNLVMDRITLVSQGNARGCEAVVFRDASVNGWTFTNSTISGFFNAIVLDHLGGPLETANNVLLNNVTIDSLHSGTGHGFYSDFVNTNIQIRNTLIDQDVPGTTDDGDYNIRFDNTTNGIIMDSVTARGSDIYTVWFNGAASNIDIRHSSFDCAQGEGVTQVIRFEGTANTVLFRKVTIDADRPATTDDGDYGLLFVGATTGVTLDSLTVNEFDGDGIYLTGANTNFLLTNSVITNNYDGIEFYNNVARSNVDIVNSSFKGAADGRSGIVINAANAVSDIDLTGDTVYNSVSHGIWLYGGAGITDMTISGCVIYDNKGAGIYNGNPTKVIYTSNSIYNNISLGIDNVAPGNCGYEGVNRPTLVSSTPMGGGQYELVINLPAIVPNGYTVDIYANDPTVSPSGGQYFVTSLTGLASGNNTRTVTYNTGPGATGVGFWTATLRIPANNCGTSEFSDRLAISTQGPGNVDANVKLWLRADATLTNNTSLPTTEGQVVNRWSDFSQGGAPNGVTSTGTVTYKKAAINFNPAGYFAGAVMQAAGNGSTWLNSPNVTSFAVFNKYTTAADGSRVYVVFDNASGGYDYNTNAESIIFGRNGATIQTHRNGWEAPVITNALGKAGLFTSVTNTNAHAMYYNGASQGATAYNKGNIHAEQWFAGGGYAAGWCCTTISDIAEVITFDRELTVAEIDRVHSYLAIKYGITMPGNYVASDGAVIAWNATANAGYTKHITGIGRDDSTFLYQKQSLSADTGIVTLALGNNIAADNASNAATINTNKSFLVFGDNGASIAYATAAGGTYVNMRMARVFKVQKTNWTDQNITLSIKGAGASNYLLISTDPTFATISQELPLSGTGAITLSSSMLTSGVYFTIGANLRGPAAVNTGIALWLKADDGTSTGALWGDFSGSGNGATQSAAVSQATALPGAVNFNPALKFDGINDYLATSSLFTATGTNNIQIYAVAATDNIQNQDLFGELVSNNYHVHAHVPWSDGNLYWDAPYGYRAQGAWGGSLGSPYLWSFLRSPSAMNVFRNRNQVAVYNAAMVNIAGSNQPFAVGGVLTSAVQPFQTFNGKIAELIVYNNSAAISTTQRQQIESYLALKYGITLNQSPATNYLASNGSVYWDAAVNGVYNKHITGIGRDSITALHQKQSRSVDTGYVTMALGNSIAASNAANAGSVTNDKSFFVVGDNGGAKTFANVITGLPGVNISLARVWKVQKTNWADQDITLATDSTLPAPQYLIISTDATFGAGDVAIAVTNRRITLNSTQFTNGAYFTFGNAFKAPGNVTAGIAAWWRADSGAAAASWDDYSGNGKTLTQPSVPNQPAVLPVNINYQPSVKFHATAWMNAASLFGTASTNNIAIFSVSAADGVGGNATGSGLFSEYVSNGDRIAAWAPYSNGHVYFYPPLGWSVQSTTPLVAYANPRFNLYGFTKTPSQLNILFNNTTVGTANGTFTGINGNNQPFILGAFNGPDWFNGRIAEFVVYNNSATMTATDRLKIQSYLALKYGITLSPAAPADYLASDGTTKMWTAADNTGYSRHITGIGRDDSSALYQKQSLSVDTGVVTLALGNAVAISNATNAGIITNDKSFFVFGDDGASAAFVTPVAGFQGITNRMTRIFKVDKTANWADQSIALKLKGGGANISLLVSTDAVFNGSDTKYVLNADSTVTLNTSNLPDGIYFTFATEIKGPNGVNKGINFWLRADDGNTSGASWKDYAGFGHQAMQNVVTGQPATDAKAINFNYGLKFDGTDDFLDINTTRLHPDSSSIFVAASGSSFATGRELVSSGGLAAANGAEFRVVAPSILQFLEADGVSVQAVNGVSTYVDNRPYIFSGTQSNLANGAKLYQNYKFDNQGSVTLSPATANFVSIGSRINAGRGVYWMGNISEVIVYNRVVTDAERQLVDSYLSLKYGITLNNGATAYLASDNSSYWSVDATYKNRITGIGRDDSTALNTKQSLSVDTGFVTLALGSNVAVTNEQNSNTITNNKSFLVFADNGLSASNFTVQVVGSAQSVTRRMQRVWKVQKTNWADQNITLKIKPIGIDNYLLISSDPTFATFSQELPVATDGTITLSSALFTGTDIYYTFGGPLKSPGGVVGHTLWVRADIGTSSTTNNTAIGEWVDMSALANTATQTTAANQPLFGNNTVDNINFNPVVKFNGSSQFMNLDITKLPMGTTPRTLIGIGSSTAPGTAPAKYLISWGSAAISQGMGLAIGDAANARGYLVGYGNDVYTNPGFWQPNVVNQMVGTWAGNGGAANLYSKMLSIGAAGAGAKTLNTTGTIARIGNSAWGAEYWNGPIGDIIVYPSELNNGQRLKIETYLALKYGYTIDQTLSNNYLATDSSVIWDATANSVYKNNIAGIGRDDEEAFRQKQSRSINSGLQVTMGLGSIDSSNTANVNTFTADRSYLVWGDNSAAITFRTAVTGSSLVNYRMARVWKVQESGTVGNVQVAIPANALPNPPASYIIVSNDATFDGSDVITQMAPVVINGVTHYAATTDIANNQYFTFAADLKVPGGVTGNTLWLRADYGTSSTTNNTSINEWSDFGADINNAVQAAAANQPVYMNNSSNNVNFNPVVRFNGTTSFMDLDITKLPMGTTARTVIGLGTAMGITGTNKYMIGWGTAATSQATVLGTYNTGAGVLAGYADDVSTAAGFWQINQPASITGIWNGSGGTASIYSKNKLLAGPVAKAWNTIGTLARIGNSSFGAPQPEYWNGNIGELIVYPFAITTVQRQQVETYMAIKYGYTIDQTTATNYLATDGTTVVWDAIVNAAYKNSITGIGRDDLEGLNQKQSRNIDTTRLRIAIGLGSLSENNIDNSNAFAADKSYLTWGDDNGAPTFKTTVAGSTTVNYRMTRVWKLQETGTVGQVEVAVPFDALPNPKQSYLVVSNDAAFDGTDTYIPLYDITLNGKKHWAAKTDFTTGQYFTIASFIKSPGGVGATSLWVRADQGILNNTDGSPVDVWVDYGNEVNNASQATAANQPVFRNNVTDNINYNPVVKFNGTSQFMNLDITKLPVGTSARTLIGVARPDALANYKYIVGYGNGAASQGMGLALDAAGVGYFVGFGDDMVTAAGFWQANVPNELFGSWAGAGGQASLYSKMLSAATPVNKNWNTTGTVARIGNSPWGSEYWSGPISEVIVFDRALSANERQRVSSYLSIRNGYTMDQTSPVNYLNTNNTVIWNATANQAYKFNIAGIGRDDIEGLSQKQSKSIQPGAMVAIGLGNIAADNPSNTYTFTSDTSYMLWGSNSTALTTTATDVPARFNQRLTQEWKLSLFNFDNQAQQPVSMEFDLTGVTHIGTTVNDFTLLIDNDGDGDFTTGAITRVTASDYSNSKVTFNNITQLTNGVVFTVAIGPQSLRLVTKVILQGAWNGSAMTTGLKTAAVLPNTDPYGQGATPAVSPNTTAAQVVDWVLVELRDTANPTTVVASRAGFVLSNGNVVDINYTQPLAFANIADGVYKVVIRHRNHLGIMSLNAVDFTSGLGTVDFTLSTTATYGSYAQKALGGGVMGMWAGDVNGDNSIRHSASPSDASAVANAVLTYPGNTSGSASYTGFGPVYSKFDVNLDGKVYSGATPSDQTVITGNVTSHPANTYHLSSYIITWQMP